MKLNNALIVSLFGLTLVSWGCGTNLDFNKSDLNGIWKTDCTNQSGYSYAPGGTFSPNTNTSRRESYHFNEHQIVRTIELFTSGTLCENLAGKLEIRGTYDILESSNPITWNSEQKQKTLQVYVTSVTASALNDRAEDLHTQFTDCPGINWTNGQSTDASFKYCAGQQLPGNYGNGTSIMHEIATMSKGDLLTLQNVYYGYSYASNQPGVNNGLNTPTTGGGYRMFFKE